MGVCGFSQEPLVKPVLPPDLLSQDPEASKPPTLLPPLPYEPVYKRFTDGPLATAIPVIPTPVWVEEKDPEGRYVIRYDLSEPRLSLELIVARFREALEIHCREDQMGPVEIKEPIQVFIGAMKLQAPGREMPDMSIAAITSIEASHVVIKAPPDQATARNFCHELAHWRMMTLQYVNIQYWVSEGVAHYYEDQGGYNHNMYRWLTYESPVTLERLGETHSSGPDSMRRRATGWLLVYYYMEKNGESWEQICRRRDHIDPSIAWAWMKDRVDQTGLEKQIEGLRKKNKAVPQDLEARLSAIKARLEKDAY